MRMRGALGCLLVVALGVIGCRDTAGLTRPVASNAPRSITPKVVVSRDSGGTALLTVALDVSGTVGKLGSFTGRLHFDPTQLVYVGDVAIGDGTTRASNHVDNVVRVAGISTNGVDVARLATLRFKVLDASALDTVRFELEEVHELSSTSLLSLVRVPNVSRAP